MTSSTGQAAAASAAAGCSAAPAASGSTHADTASHAATGAAVAGAAHDAPILLGDTDTEEDEPAAKKAKGPIVLD